MVDKINYTLMLYNGTFSKMSKFTKKGFVKSFSNIISKSVHLGCSLYKQFFLLNSKSVS